MATGLSGDVIFKAATYYQIKLSWTETYDVNKNSSVVSVRMYLWNDNDSNKRYTKGSIVINGTNVVTMNYSNAVTHGTTSSAYKNWQEIVAYNNGSNPPWSSGDITHSADGSKSISIGIKDFYIYDSDWGETNIGTHSETIKLTTIPRTSSLSLSTASVNVGGTITANITRASTSFTHTVEFYINDSYKQTYNGIATSQSFTIPSSWYNAMPTTTSRTAYCKITTYSGSTKIGDSVAQAFAVNVPTTIVPTVGTITLDPTDINGKNILVKGKNALTVSVSGCSAGTGSSIKSYTFSGPSISSTTTSTSVSASSVSQTGTLTYTVTVTDNRGRTSSKTATIVCYDYDAPKITSFNAFRANSDGSTNANGSYIKITYGTSYSSVNNTNSVSVTAYYNSKNQTVSNGSLINLNGDTVTIYKVYLKITDSYGGSSTSSSITIFGESRILNIKSDGKGIAFGTVAKQDGLECGMDAYFYGQTYRVGDDGTKEYFFPPMVPGNVYRTAERFQGKPVYTACVYVESLPNATTKTVAFMSGVYYERLISIEGTYSSFSTDSSGVYNNEYALVPGNGIKYVMAAQRYNGTHFEIRTDSDMSKYSAYITIKFIK